MSANKLSIEQAKPDKLFYIVANLIPIREDGRALILKRDERERVYPGKWATIGGKMEHKDFDIKNPTDQANDVLTYESPLFKLLRREALEETSIIIEPPLVFVDNKLIVRPDEIPVVLMTFAATVTEQEIKLEDGAFTDSAWVTSQEAEQYDCIQSVPSEIKAAIEAFS